MDHRPSVELLESIHTFPGDYKIKAIGMADDDFEGRVVEAVCSHLPARSDLDYSVRTTPGGRHVAITLDMTRPDGRTSAGDLRGDSRDQGFDAPVLIGRLARKGSMTDASASPQWIDVSQADDLRDVIHRAVACLAQGGVVGLATETVYGLAACALNAESVARVRALRDRPNCPPVDLAFERPRRSHRLGAAHLAGGTADGLAALAWAGHSGLLTHRGRWSLQSSASRVKGPDLARRRRRVSQSGPSDRPRGACGCCPRRWLSRWWRRPHIRSPRPPSPCVE